MIDQATQASKDKAPGGFSGLKHMLRDKDVRHGIQTLAHGGGALNAPIAKETHCRARCDDSNLRLWCPCGLCELLP
ncbi:MAG: hypothetical protein B7Z83_10075, partial [Thiomonas sp. 20-64-5]